MSARVSWGLELVLVWLGSLIALGSAAGAVAVHQAWLFAAAVLGFIVQNIGWAVRNRKLFGGAR
jgi:thiosulfate reductase cytochrome b subunit